MMRWAYAFLLFFLPSTVFAQAIEVSSGEHAGFSRLAIQLPKATDWSLRRFEDGYVFFVDDPDAAFELETVFKLIPRTRIQRVTDRGSGQLLVSVADNVHADVFELRNGLVVVDIKDGAPDPNAALEAQFNPKPSPGAIKPRQDDAPLPNLSIGFGGIVIDKGMQEENAGALPGLDPIQASTPPAPEALELPNTRNDLSSRLSVPEFEQQLARQLGRASSQGLVDVDTPLPWDTEGITQNSPPNAIAGPAQDDQFADLDSAHVNIRSAMDQSFEPQKGPSNTLPDGLQCVESDLLAIETWGSPLEEGLSLSDARSDVVREMDISNIQSVEKLAKYYLYLTFGAEAKVVLREFDVFVPSSDMLTAIADIMDFGQSLEPSALLDQIECDGPAAFWALMAQPTIPKGVQYNKEAVGLTFSLLPLHLRRHLGPILSQRLLLAGDENFAKLIRNAIARSEGGSSDAMELLNARLELADGNIPPALNTLDTLVVEGGPSSPEALVRSVEARVQAGQALDQTTIETIDAFLPEHRGSEVGADLLRVSILARIHSNAPQDALKMLQALPVDSGIEDSIKINLREMALQKISKASDSLNFALVAVEWAAKQKLADLSLETRVSFAERLESLGLYEVAEGFMPEGDQSQQLRPLAARIAKGLGRYDEALAHLAGLSDPNTIKLRADIHLLVQDPEKAAKDYRMLGDETAAGSADLLSENWESLSASENQGFADVAKLKLSPFTAQSTDVTPITLEATSKIVENSQKVRASLTAILD